MSRGRRFAIAAVGLALSAPLLLAGSKTGHSLAGPARQPPPHAAPRAAAAPPAPPRSASGGDVRRGADLFALHCASCHGSIGQGTPDGIPLAGIGAAAVDFVLATGRMPLSDPHQPMMRRGSNWTRRQIDDIVAFVTSLGPGGPPIPVVHPEAGDLTTGGQIYAENCAPCHGASGQGAAVGGGADAPDLYEATAVEVAEAVRIGPDPMPRFDTRQINAHELDSLVRYVEFLPRLPDRGGFSLGHIGPVAEGFIAWIVGLGAIVVIVRLIGTPN
ncbi:MAG TPA: c-type cytochrome [bacterium]|nr:c-type cytochrome [bacterium]